jgi:hypothetical protein
MLKKLTIFASAALCVLAVAAPAAVARSCGTYETTSEGSTISVDAYYGATCSFGRATASRLYASAGVPRHLTVMGTRLTRRTTRHADGATFWLYDGVRHGHYGSVIVTEDAPSAVAPSAPPSTVPPSTPSTPTSPTVLPPGNGYPVRCNDGSISTSGGIQGACSHHGGVAP